MNLPSSRIAGIVAIPKYLGFQDQEGDLEQVERLFVLEIDLMTEQAIFVALRSRMVRGIITAQIHQIHQFIRYVIWRTFKCFLVYLV